VLFTVILGLLGYVASLATEVGGNLIPPSWTWLHNPRIFWPIFAVLAAAAIVLGVVLQRLTDEDEDKDQGMPEPMAEINQDFIGNFHDTVVGSNTGTLNIYPQSNSPHKQKASVSSASDQENSLPAIASNLPRRNRLFTGRIELLEALKRNLISGPVAVVAVQGLVGQPYFVT
jgi:hypothetical protein